MLDDFIESCWSMPIFFVVMISLMATLIYFDYQNNLEWSKFASAHCKVVGHMTGSIRNGIAIGSKEEVNPTFTVEPSKTGYSCDDGQTYWR